MGTPIRSLLCLPGASGNRATWRAVSEQLTHPARRTFIGWPFFDDVPADPSCRSFDDLVARVVADIDRSEGPVALLAQSMGGVIAVRAALQRPAAVRCMVLAATSGGIDVAALGGSDWRTGFAHANPDLPRWFLDEARDLSVQLSGLETPCLLLWGDADPISPVAVGERLQALLPHAALHVIAGGDHDFVQQYAREVAPLVEQHLTRCQ
ncbi:MAG: alpha/beta fold hydrolase [Polyangiales bacterium]